MPWSATSTARSSPRSDSCRAASARRSLLRYYLDLTEEETAQAMGVSRGTVKSATYRVLAAIGRILKEES